VNACTPAHIDTIQTTAFMEVLTFTRPIFTYVNTYLKTPLTVNFVY